MELIQAPGQKQLLSQAMAQSLSVLQMPLPELYQYISDREMENPLLDVVEPERMLAQLPGEAEPTDVIWETEDSGFRSERSRGEAHEEAPILAAGENFYDMLHHQLSEEVRLPDSLLPLCHFVVDSLNARGYLEESHELLAEIYGAPAADMLQAVYAVQEMSPTGVGARSLPECLILQLVQTPDFHAHTVRLIKEGLEYLAANDISAIAKLLETSRAEAEKACNAVRRLNPIPSRGYDTGERESFVIPEAEIRREGERLIVRYNDDALPRISINLEYQKMLAESENPQLVQYLKQHLASANQLIREVDGRKRTVTRVLESLLRRQRPFFDHGFTALEPLLPSDVAEELGLSRSTVSRSVQGKYILTPMGLLEMKQLFSARSSASGEESAASVKERLKTLISAEDTASPMSDDKLCQALQAFGITISRRTVAKYRDSMGIPAAFQRKRTAK